MPGWKSGRDFIKRVRPFYITSVVKRGNQAVWKASLTVSEEMKGVENGFTMLEPELLTF